MIEKYLTAWLLFFVPGVNRGECVNIGGRILVVQALETYFMIFRLCEISELIFSMSFNKTHKELEGVSSQGSI